MRSRWAGRIWRFGAGARGGCNWAGGCGLLGLQGLFQRLNIFGKPLFKQAPLVRRQLLRLSAVAPAFQARQFKQQGIDLGLAVLEFLRVAMDDRIAFEQCFVRRGPQCG